MKAAVVTVSDGVSEGTREDESGEVLAELLAGEGYEVERRIVSDDRDAIADAIAELAEEVALVLTSASRPGSRRRCERTRSRRRPTRCSPEASPEFGVRPWSSISPARPAAAATASTFYARRWLTRWSSWPASRLPTSRRERARISSPVRAARQV